MTTEISATPAARPELSVIFPAFNEEPNILTTLSRAVEYLDRLALRHEVLVVDDGSRDGTASLVRELALTHPAVRLLQHPRNLGYGAALRSGFRAAAGDWVFFMDADGQFDIRDLGRLLARRDGYDALLGYRARRRDHRIRLLNAAGWNWLVRLALGVAVRDVDCAFKLFRGDMLRSLALGADGASINAEILAKAFERGCRVAEFPVRHYPRTAGRATGANPRVIVRALKELAGLWLNVERGRWRSRLLGRTHAIQFQVVNRMNSSAWTAGNAAVSAVSSQGRR